MKSELQVLVGRRICERREALGITKAKFCLMAGISRPYLDHIESGEANVTLKMLERIADSLGARVADLVQ